MFLAVRKELEVAWLAFNNMMHGTYGYNDTPKYDPSTSEGSKETIKLETFLKDFSKEWTKAKVKRKLKTSNETISAAEEKEIVDDAQAYHPIHCMGIEGFKNWENKGGEEESNSKQIKGNSGSEISNEIYTYI